jgi:hypothetical protein
LRPAHEPREDLEAAVERVNERVVAVTELDDAQACPGGRFLVGILTRAVAAVEADDDA